MNICLFSQGKQPSRAVIFDGTWQKKAVPDVYYHYADESKKLSIEKLLANPQQFQFEKSKGSAPTFWASGTPYWFRFNLQNVTYVNQDLYFQLHISLYDQTDFYIVENGKIIDRQSLSWRTPQYKRAVKHRNFIFPYTLHAKQNVMCYVKIQKEFGSIWLPITIWKKEHFDYSFFLNDYHNWGFFTGVLAFVAFFSFMLSFAFKDRVYAFYATYVFFAIGFVYTMQGYFIRFYVDGSWGVEGNKVRYAASLILLISNLAFLREYFQWNLLGNKFWWKMSSILMVILSILLFLMYLDFLAFNNYLFNLAPSAITIFYSLFFWIAPLFQVVGVLYCIKNNHNRRNSIYYMLANLPILIMAIYTILSSYELIQGNHLVEIDYFAAAFFVEIIALSILMAYRIKLVQDHNEGLLHEKAFQLQQRTEAVLEAEERERVRIARDLHDGVGQMLAAARMALGKYVSKENLQVDEITNASELLEDSIKEIREVSHNMMPGTLMKFGLSAALKQFVNKINAAGGVIVNLQIVGVKERLDERIEMMLYRIIQEITSNIIRHSGATKMSIELIQHDAELVLLVEDDGRGFDTQNLENQGIGLKNIATRVEYLSGSVIFDSALGRGTSVVVEVPLNS